MKKYLPIILILAVLGGSYGFYEYNRSHQNMHSAKADLTMSSVELFKQFEEDESAANTQFLDKIVAVSGKIMDISKTEDAISVTLESEGDFGGVICQLDETAKHKRTDFKVGELANFKGVCTGMLMDVVMVRCVEI